MKHDSDDSAARRRFGRAFGDALNAMMPGATDVARAAALGRDPSVISRYRSGTVPSAATLRDLVAKGLPGPLLLPLHAELWPEQWPHAEADPRRAAPMAPAFGLVAAEDAAAPVVRPHVWRPVPNATLDPTSARRLDLIEAWAAREMGRERAPLPRARGEFLNQTLCVAQRWRAAWFARRQFDGTSEGRFATSDSPAPEYSISIVRSRRDFLMPEPQSPTDVIPDEWSSPAAMLVYLAVCRPAYLAALARRLLNAPITARQQLERAALVWWRHAEAWSDRDGALAYVADAFVSRVERGIPATPTTPAASRLAASTPPMELEIPKTVRVTLGPRPRRARPPLRSPLQRAAAGEIIGDPENLVQQFAIQDLLSEPETDSSESDEQTSPPWPEDDEDEWPYPERRSWWPAAVTWLAWPIVATAAQRERDPFAAEAIVLGEWTADAAVKEATADLGALLGARSQHRRGREAVQIVADLLPEPPVLASLIHEPESHGGTYKGGRGSSHRGGTYQNPRTADDYWTHKP